MHKFPTPCILQSGSPFLPSGQLTPIVLFLLQNTMQHCDVFHASCPLANAISSRLLSHTSPISASVLSLTLPLPCPPALSSYRQSFAVLAKLVLMIYTDHNILTECIFWEFLNFPTVMKYVLWMTLFSSENSDSTDPQKSAKVSPL